MINATEGTEAKAFFRSLVKPAREDLRDHQRERRGQNGAWAPLDPDTWRKRAAKRRKPGKRRRRRAPKNTRMLGRLPRAWKSTVTEDGLQMRNMVRWSRAHDEGAVVGNGARLPRRQFAFLGSDFVNGASDIYVRHVMRGWRRA